MASSRPRIRTAALALAAAAALLPLSAAADPAVRSAPVMMVEKTIDEVLGVLRDPALSTADQRRRLEEIAAESFDFQTMSRLVLARNWKRFSKPQQKEFVEEFKNFLAHTYGDRVNRYNDEKAEVTGERQEPRGDVTVFTRIVGGEYNDAVVEYRLRKQHGDWRVIDIKVEGISLVFNYRDQFKEVMNRSGPEGLLERLRKKNLPDVVNES
jgi:phospholipid transport system substrate-binding protein